MLPREAIDNITKRKRNFKGQHETKQNGRDMSKNKPIFVIYISMDPGHNLTE